MIMWLLYNLQGFLIPVGGIVSRTLLLLILVISLYYFVYANIRIKLPKPLKILSALVIFFTLYGLEPILFGTGDLAFKVAPFGYLKTILISLLPIYVFYVFFERGLLSEKDIMRWTVAFVAVAIGQYYIGRQQFLERIMEAGSNREEFTNNAGYILVSVLPLLALFWRKPFRQYVLLGVCMLYVLMGFKRGAILSGALCSIWFIFASFKSENRTRKSGGSRMFTRLLLTVVIIAVAVYAVQRVMMTSDYFNYRVQQTVEGESSLREINYNFFWNHFINENNPFRFLFGYGANGTLKIWSNYAHNDWLEIAINNGLIVLLIYAYYWISLFGMFLKGNRRAIPVIMLGMFIIIYFIRSLVSMSYGDISIYASSALAYALVYYERKK